MESISNLVQRSYVAAFQYLEQHRLNTFLSSLRLLGTGGTRGLIRSSSIWGEAYFIGSACVFIKRHKTTCWVYVISTTADQCLG